MLPDHWSTEGRIAGLKQLDQHDWDIVIIGGGISGAGLLFEASRRGYKALLLEKDDFASGSSSQSSKLVHGGIRYLASGQFTLTREAVKARERLCQQLPGLVNHLPMIMPHYHERPPRRASFRLLMWCYDALAGKKLHRNLPAEEMQQDVPLLRNQGCYAATEFKDALTDDARLTLRVLLEANQLGGTAYNYSKVERVENSGKDYQVYIQAEHFGALHVNCRQVIHATGAWTQTPEDELVPYQVRPLRGSHLLFSAEKLPLEKGVCLFHPSDQRLMFALPWMGYTLVGTTDLDHQESLDNDVRIQPDEQAYIYKALHHYFPGASLTYDDCISAWSGVRPVLSDPSDDELRPSDVAREHKIWRYQGQLYLCGGKLTTFQVMAKDAIDQLDFQPLNSIPEPWPELGANTRNQGSLPVPEALIQLYGADADQLNEAEPALDKIPKTPHYWAELHWALRYLAINHLDDLLIRRTRIGLFFSNGGEHLIPELKTLCGEYLNWTEQQFEKEWDRYQTLHKRFYQPYRK